MAGSFEVRQGRFGAELVLTGPWQPEFATFMKHEALRELVLNYSLGWADDDVEFLSDMPWLRALTVIHREIEDVGPVTTLRELRSLHLESFCETQIDFSSFPQLEQCTLQWRRGSESIFSCDRLEKLVLMNFPGQFSNDFARLALLRDVSLYGGGLKDLHGIGRLPKLQAVGLYNLRQLETLEGIHGLVRLRRLEVIDCPRVRNIEAISNLRSLEDLSLSDIGQIPDLAPIALLSQLRAFFFTGRTKVLNGDLGVLLALPLLQEVSFQNRRHYNVRREEVRKHLSLLQPKRAAEK